ncbi:MAG: HutP family protein [Syntrophothermus sp.]
MLVREMMQTAFLVVDAGTEIAEVQRLMVSQNHSRVVVTEGDKVVGIVTDSDLLRGHRPDVPVRDVMSKELIKVYDNQTVREAGHRLLDHKIDGLPVFSREEKLVGLLTSRDILKGYLRDEDKNRLTVESSAIYLSMTRSREYEYYWLEKIQGYGYKAAITQVGAGSEKLAIKLRESTIAAAIARGVIAEDAREKLGVSNAVRDAYVQLEMINPGLGGGFKIAAVRGEGRVAVAIFGHFGHALVDGPEQLAVGFSIV